MIVIAIIAIIASIAIPNLLESRVSAQETSAATALRSGILPAEVQFQSGGYVDHDGDGVGSFAVGATAYDLLSGTAATSSGIRLNLLAPMYRGSNPTISNYVYQNPVCGTSASDDVERTWAVVNYPTDANNGRRRFACNQSGRVFASIPLQNAASSADPLTVAIFDSNLSGLPDSTVWRPYSR